MSLKTDWWEAPGEEKTLLTVRYTVRYVVPGNAAPYYLTTRTATKSCTKFGMTRQAAMDCLAYKIEQYTRSYYRSRTVQILNFMPVPILVEETKCGAKITAKQDHGDAWRVDIEINETDEVPSDEPHSYPPDLFAEIVSGRFYD